MTIQPAPSQQTNVAGTGAVAIIAASGAAGSFRDLLSLVITTTNAVAGTLTISDGTKTVFVLNFPDAALAPGAPLVVLLQQPIQQTTSNTAWTITASANASGYNVTAQFCERP